ncbi:hypothetical protein JYU10_00740 [bacterium AH-315-J04]|nr:hypothetical protein [bacterium AH-315-J04]
MIFQLHFHAVAQACHETNLHDDTPAPEILAARPVPAPAINRAEAIPTATQILRHAPLSMPGLVA